MGNPRQRRKARSSSHKPISLSHCARKRLKKMPPIQGPKVLQDAWDKKKTVRQNYTALGLVHTLNPSASGGCEVGDELEADGRPAGPDMPSCISVEFGKIVRNEAGNVVQVQMAAEELGDLPDRNPETMREPEIIPEAKEKWVTRMGKQSDGPYQSGDRHTIKALAHLPVMQKSTTTMSIRLTGIGARHSSSGEIKYLQRLVNKYGCDVTAMAKDRKLNAGQHTAGELQRALKRSGLFAGKGGDRDDLA